MAYCTLGTALSFLVRVGINRACSYTTGTIFFLTWHTFRNSQMVVKILQAPGNLFYHTAYIYIYPSLVPRLLCGGGEREPGTHCLHMCQVPLVTCILLRYTKIMVNLFLKQAELYSLWDTYRQFWSQKQHCNIALMVMVCIARAECLHCSFVVVVHTEHGHSGRHFSYGRSCHAS